jgi:hypothetical protein
MTATQEPIYTGDDVSLVAVFRNRLKTLADPTTVSGKVYHPETNTEYPIVFINQSVGVWEATFAPDQEGAHWWSANGTGTIAKSGERSFNVTKRRAPE